MTNGDLQSPSALLTIDQALQQAVSHHQAGRLAEAEHLYRTILQVQPDYPDANHNLGVLAVQVKQPAAALPHFKAALAANPDHGQYWLSYIDVLAQTGQIETARQVLEQGRQRGLQGEAVDTLATQLGCAGSVPDSQQMNTLAALFNAGRIVEAASLARAMTTSDPENGVGWKALGVALAALGQPADALAPFKKAAALLPNDAETHHNLANSLRENGQFAEAVISCRHALAINPNYVEAHFSLANSLRGLGKLDDAVASYRQALAIWPEFAEAHSNLGATFADIGNLDDAEASYRRALEIRPNFAEALGNLAVTLSAQGRFMMALNAIRQALQVMESVETRNVFCACAKHLRFAPDDAEMRAALVRALTEPWDRPSELVITGIDLVKRSPGIGECVERAVKVWPQRLSAPDLFRATDMAALAGDPLFCALLDAAPVCDNEMEQFLTLARSALLDTAAEMGIPGEDAGAVLNFAGSLAHQCFVNEYVFSHTDDEIRKARDLRDALVVALETDSPVPDIWPVVVGAYFPLCALPLMNRLLDRQWPDVVTAVLVQQLVEPAEEQRLRATIPCLTVIEDEVSLLVQSQYEENPYPRWVKTAPAGVARPVARYLGEMFPLARFSDRSASRDVDVLIAGCGTGEQSIETAQRLQGARVLAVDLSMSSLCYAKRKTRELGLTSIEYAQADLMKLSSVGRSFDVIESVGVLHHLADPWAGWTVLLSLLRPGGFMRLGFYSEVARRNIVKVQSLLAERGYGATADEVRRCRQDLVHLNKSQDFGSTLKSADFFSTSTCRDLLLHVQEHRMALTGINAFLRKNELTFLGFEAGPDVLHAYRQMFPADHAATNLEQWQVFEHDNPDTFLGMYQFWIQKSNREGR